MLSTRSSQVFDVNSRIKVAIIVDTIVVAGTDKLDGCRNKDFKVAVEEANHHLDQAIIDRYLVD